MREELCLSALVDASGNDLKVILHALGVNRKTWNDWLWGISEPSKNQREMLARWLNCSAVAIDVAVARNRASWERCRLWLSADNTLRDEKSGICRVIAGTIIRVVLSVATSVVTTLALLGKL